MASEERYAQVAVGVAADKLFLYRIPPSLQESISLGKKVLVPLGRRLVIGHIVGLLQEAPPIPLKDILQVLGEEPFLDAHLLELTRKIADHYLAPWGEVIRLALPSATRSPGRWVFRLAPDKATPPPSLLPLERKIWETLSLASPSSLSLNQLRRRVSTRDLDPALGRMQKRGWLIRQMVPAKPRPAAKAELPFTSPPEISSIAPLKGEDLPAELLPLRSFIEKPCYGVFLLLGGSRRERTLWYQRLFDLLLRSGKGSLLLVPEIGLASSWVEELGSRYGSQIAFLHSGLSAKERERQWKRIQEGRGLIAIGTRSAAFTPHPRLGLILIDEEHDPSYKQEEGPRFHAREVALARAEMLKIPLLLASATPSVESFYKAEQGEYRLLTIPEHQREDSARITLVDMRMESKEKGRAPLISRPLQEAIEKRLAVSEQVVLLINRRGYFAHLVCRECGFRLQCPRCSVPLVLHRAKRRLLCHQCGKEESPPDRCLNCKGVIMSYLGPGTQQVEEEVRRLFPGASVARFDRDALPGQARAKKLIHFWGQDDMDIIVGTQMILRSPHFGRASLIGVLFADNLLSLPDFRAGERLFCLLMEMIQDRRENTSAPQIIVQTYNPGHYVLQAVKAQDYLLFYRREIASREALSLPPFVHLAHIEVSAKSEDRARGAAFALASLLRAKSPSSPLLEGPAPSSIYRRKGEFHWRLLVKGERGLLAGRLAQALGHFGSSAAKAKVTLRLDIDPLRLY